MDEVSEVMSILIGMGRAGVTTAEEIVKMTIRLLANAGNVITGSKSQSQNEKKSMLGKGKEAIANVLPFVGTTGKITRGELARLNGDTQYIKLKSDNLKEFQKLCKKYRVAFNVVKLDNGDYHAFFKASDLGVIKSCMEQLAIKEYGMTEDEVAELKEPEITRNDIEFKQAENGRFLPVLPSLDEKMNYAKQDWSLVDRKDGQIEYKAESGIYDLTARVDGSYSVSKMGKEVYTAERSSVECNGLKTAMLNASLVAMADKRNLNKSQEKQFDVVKGDDSKKVDKLPRTTMLAKSPMQESRVAIDKAESRNVGKPKTKKQTKGTR